MMRALVPAAMVIVFAAIGPAGVVAQSATPLGSPEDPAASVDRSPFPSADEVSALVGIEMEASGISDGLSQLWEGIEFDHQQDVPSAQMQIYRTPDETPPDQMYGVMVVTQAFASDDGFAGAFILLRDGPVAIAITTVAFDDSETESRTEAIAEFVQDRLVGALWTSILD